MDNTAASPRDLAIRRIKARHDLRVHLVAYLTVNSMLVVIWFFTGATGTFWPIFPIAGWGVGLLLHAYGVFFDGPITEEQIEREMGKQA